MTIQFRLTKLFIFFTPTFAGALAMSDVPAKTTHKPAMAANIVSLSATPAQVKLIGKYAETRILVEAKTSTGMTTEIGSKAEWSVANPNIASVDDSGIVHPIADGKTTITVKYQGKDVRIPFFASKVALSAAPRFVSDVMPILAKAGCNSGACHGATQGKGGFKLSMQGYDADFDYIAVTRGSMGRRISRSQPENSLLLRKPILRVSHKGGLRFKADSAEFRVLRDWIAAGIPGPDEKEPAVIAVNVSPAVRTLPIGAAQRFVVKAKYADGTVRDVTGEAIFTAAEESVAKVSTDGEATVTGNGEGAVLVRYAARVAMARVISPFGKPREAATPKPSNLTASTDPANAAAIIDQFITRKLASLGLPASSRSQDFDFLRRSYLDVIGILPNADEARSFLTDKNPKKREQLVDSLLERPEFVDFWSLKWGDLLKSNRNTLSDKGMISFNNWIRTSVRQNKPWDEFAKDILTSKGSPYEGGPANFYHTANTPETLAETTAQAFMGVRIQCARCHNHPYDKWLQNQYYEMAAFFARVKGKKGIGEKENLVLTSNGGEVTHLRTKKQVGPCALDAKPLPADYKGDRRDALAEWLASDQNPYFSRSIINRIWRHYFGKGMVEPVDDLRLTNPPMNGELFDWLAKDLVAHKYDLRHLMKSILLSQTYQRSAEPVKGNERDAKFLSHYPFKRMTAEQLSDALTSVTGVPEKFAGYPSGMRASQLPDATVQNYFLELFGKPARNVTCECERSDDPNLGQVLHLMNNSGINGRLADKKGRIAGLIAAKKTDVEIAENLYMSSVSRFPTPAESKLVVTALASAKDKQQKAEDLLWALMNSKEFIFNH